LAGGGPRAHSSSSSGSATGALHPTKQMIDSLDRDGADQPMRPVGT